MSRKLVYFMIISLILLILHINIFSFLLFRGNSPDLLLLLVICAGFLEDKKYSGVYFGFALGILQDMLLGGMFGIYTITKTLIGGMADLVADNIYKKSLVFPPVMAFVASFIQEYLVIFFSMSMFSVIFRSHSPVDIFTFSIYNTLLMFFLYLIVYYFILGGGQKYEW